MNYELIIIILNYSENYYFKKLKKIHSKYLEKFSKVKFIFSEFNTNIKQDTMVENNTFYINGTNLNLCLDLTLKYINNNFDYKYILITEINNFINITNVLSYINSLPNKPIYSGFYSVGYVLKKFILLNKISCNYILEYYLKENYSNYDIEIIISQIMNINNVPYIEPKNYNISIITDKKYVCRFNNNFIYYQTLGDYNKYNFDKKSLIINLDNTSEILNLVYIRDLFNYFITS
jgi:hypothetical protein